MKLFKCFGSNIIFKLIKLVYQKLVYFVTKETKVCMSAYEMSFEMMEMTFGTTIT